jgi:hypothetical protein
VTLRARWVTLRARWVTLRARWVTLQVETTAEQGQATLEKEFKFSSMDVVIMQRWVPNLDDDAQHDDSLAFDQVRFSASTVLLCGILVGTPV